EIKSILKKDAEVYCEWYGITEKGNWEGKNIMHITKEPEDLAKQHDISLPELEELISKCDQQLLKERNKRPRPLTDDKILLGWNALLVTALCKSYAALGKEEYKDAAVALFDFIIQKFSKEDEIVYHSYKNGKAKHPAFLEDHAYLVQACIFLQEITADQQYLLKAKKFTDYVITNFENKETGFFYFTHEEQKDVV